jgi:hypothetical protein
MAEFVEVEWFGREDKIGIVLTYDEFDGFKARMSPLPKFPYQEPSEEMDIQYLMREAAKIPFEWAWGIFGGRMKSEWIRRHLADKNYSIIRYDHRDYDAKTLKEVR